MLTFDFSQTSLDITQQGQLEDLLQEFGSLFSSGDTKPERTGIIKHAIKTEGPPICQQMRQLPVSVKGVVEQEVQQMLEHDVVRPSNSPWSSPVVLVRKRDAWVMEILCGFSPSQCSHTPRCLSSSTN